MGVNAGEKTVNELIAALVVVEDAQTDVNPEVVDASTSYPSDVAEEGVAGKGVQLTVRLVIKTLNN